jgi:serine protease Do
MIRPGTRVMLSVWRKGTMRDLAVTVAEMPDDIAGATPRRGAPPKEKARPNRMGLVLSDLTDEQKKELELKSGVLIEDVTGTVRGNVQPGDVILAIISRGSTTEARSAEQVNALLAKLEKGASVAMRLRRGDATFIATIRLNNGE